MIAAFDLGQVHRSPARFDYAKLENMNGHYLRDANDDNLLKALIDTLPYLTGGAALAQQLDATKQNQLRAALPGLKARAKTLNELVDGAAFIFAKRPLPLDEKASLLLNAEARARLAALSPKFEALKTWDAHSTETIVRETAESLGVKLGEVAQPLRAALTGRATSPGILTFWKFWDATRASLGLKIKALNRLPRMHAKCFPKSEEDGRIAKFLSLTANAVKIVFVRCTRCRSKTGGA